MWVEVILQGEAKRTAITHDKEELKEEREKDSERGREVEREMGKKNRMGGISNLGNTFLKQEKKKKKSWNMNWRQGGGEKNALKEKGCMYGKGKGHVHTVYSQMNERVTGEVMKNHVKKVQAWVWREVQFLLILEFCILSFFPRFCQFPIQPSLLPKSIPY